MVFNLVYGTPNIDLFKHKLLQQVIDIRIETCSCMLSGSLMGTDIRCVTHPVDGNIRILSPLREISFPSIRSWRIEAKNEFFASLDLSSADAIEFWSTNRPTNRLFAPIPNQLTNLKLDRVIFTIESLPGGQRYSLPYLTSLTLRNIIFFGPMRKYFHCPKLGHLLYTIFSRSSTLGTAIEGCKNPYQVPIQHAFDKIFFQETPVLEFIILEGTTLDDALVPILASCPALHSLEIEDCRMESFIHPFLDTLQDTKSFPSMKMIHIDGSWPAKLDLSYQEFVAQSIYRRPEIYISGDEQQEPSATFYDENQFDSDVLSDLGTDSETFDSISWLGP
jgi:hypothetical protein